MPSRRGNSSKKYFQRGPEKAPAHPPGLPVIHGVQGIAPHYLKYGQILHILGGDFGSISSGQSGNVPWQFGKPFRLMDWNFLSVGLIVLGRFLLLTVIAPFGWGTLKNLLNLRRAPAGMAPAQSDTREGF